MADRTAGQRDEEGVRRVVERLAMMLTEWGFPRMPARVLGSMMTADEDSLTAADLAERLGVSAAAISGAVRYLTHIGMISKEPAPGPEAARHRRDADRGGHRSADAGVRPPGDDRHPRRRRPALDRRPARGPGGDRLRGDLHRLLRPADRAGGVRRRAAPGHPERRHPLHPRGPRHRGVRLLEAGQADLHLGDAMSTRPELPEASAADEARPAELRGSWSGEKGQLAMFSKSGEVKSLSRSSWISRSG